MIFPEDFDGFFGGGEDVAVVSFAQRKDRKDPVQDRAINTVNTPSDIAGTQDKLT